jgi:hypothetical protein
MQLLSSRGVPRTGAVPRSARRARVVRAAVACPPSSAPAASELESLQALSTVIPDSLGFETGPGVKLATASVGASVLRTMLASGSLGTKTYEAR